MEAFEFFAVGICPFGESAEPEPATNRFAALHGPTQCDGSFPYQEVVSLLRSEWEAVEVWDDDVVETVDVGDVEKGERRQVRVAVVGSGAEGAAPEEALNEFQDRSVVASERDDHADTETTLLKTEVEGGFAVHKTRQPVAE